MNRKPAPKLSPALRATEGRYFATVNAIGLTVAHSAHPTRGALAPKGPATFPTEGEDLDFNMGA